MGLLEYLKEKQETDMIITGLQTDYVLMQVSKVLMNMDLILLHQLMLIQL